jgi:HSP20 family protein
MAKELTVKEESRPAANEHTRPGRTYLPNVDIRETEEALWVWADMPGVDENSIDVHLEEGGLQIEGRVVLEEYESLVPLYTEYNVGNFVRNFRINNQIDRERITAKLSHGVLQVQLPKVGRALPRRVPVSAA